MWQRLLRPGEVRPRPSRRLQRGAATWVDCGNSGTTTAGLIRRDATGSLFRYSGKPDGTVVPACKFGVGWNIMSKVVRHGNGSEDVIAVDGSGVLRLYPADGAAGHAARKQVAYGFPVGELVF